MSSSPPIQPFGKCLSVPGLGILIARCLCLLEIIRILFNPKLGLHDDVIKWKHFPRNWPFVREIHRSPVNFPHKGQWRGALMFSLIYVWINDWVNNREAGDLRRQHGHYDVNVMILNDTVPYINQPHHCTRFVCYVSFHHVKLWTVIFSNKLFAMCTIRMGNNSEHKNTNIPQTKR